MATPRTRLRGLRRGEFFHLYVLLDLYSRYAPGWMLATVERAELARRLIDATIAEHDVDPTALTVHSDRGVPAAKPVAQLLADLEITRSVTRPRTPNDNPYSEAQFPTMKYRPTFPDRFAGIDASVPLVDIARRRVPHGDLRAGDMFALPWDDASFDVVTSFNGIWGGCTDALREARRVLRDGGTSVSPSGARARGWTCATGSSPSVRRLRTSPTR